MATVDLIIAAVQAILQVMTVVFFGFILTKRGYFDMPKQKWLSRLNLVFFTPCLLFSNVASIISVEKLIAFWPIPVFYAVFIVISYIASQTTTRIMGMDAGYRRFVLACVLFSNTNSLPIAIISSLAVSEAAHILFWTEGDTPETVAARGISYTLFFAIFGNLVRWSYGYNLLRKREDEIVDIDSLSSTTTDSDQISENNYVGSGNNDRNANPHNGGGYQSMDHSESSSIVDQDADLEARILRPNHRTPSTATLAIQNEDRNGAGSVLGKKNSKYDANDDNSNERTGLLSNSINIQQQNVSGFDRFVARVPGGRFIVRVAKRFDSFMSPPLYAAMLALIVGLTPLKPLLYAKDSFLYPSFTKAIETCGKAAVPLILTCLGAQLTCISETQHETSPAMKKPVATAIGVRMVLMPLLVIPVVVLFVLYGAQWSSLAKDPVFIIMMIVLPSTPTAINLVQITQVNNIFEEEMLHMLFWSYGVVCVPVCTVLVFAALNIVDRLL
ncbi:auxin efflux carrier [Phycomyces blakesleeanus]|uniref:Auxin efflux carrier n=1 Tax=Phycomyces blakesleeanus TaxID=4837 RepID=A0ABR3B0Q1_PHYBL